LAPARQESLISLIRRVVLHPDGSFTFDRDKFPSVANVVAPILALLAGSLLGSPPPARRARCSRAGPAAKVPSEIKTTSSAS